ncbi:MAG: hypothetical protein JSR80_07660 [Verrucomicrobia bacterium]|nr:hypothetical protein [Verrucomicrobiota bacterium]
MKCLLALVLLTIPLFSQSGPRPYNAAIQAEVNEINFIATTLADKSYAELVFYRKQLSVSGEKVDHLHPLIFCLVIFSDERLKVAIRNIRKKGLVWKEFISGVGNSFAREFEQKNICPEHITHFANALKVDPAKIRPALDGQKWETFIELLIELIPREGPVARYDF